MPGLSWDSASRASEPQPTRIELSIIAAAASRPDPTSAIVVIVGSSSAIMRFMTQHGGGHDCASSQTKGARNHALNSSIQGGLVLYRSRMRKTAKSGLGKTDRLCMRPAASLSNLRTTHYRVTCRRIAGPRERIEQRRLHGTAQF